MASTKYSEHAEELAQQLIHIVESGKAPWQRGYIGGFSEPTSFLTDKPYQNSNALKLLFTGIERGYEDNRWITKNQIEKEGGSISDFRKGVPILYYSDTKTVREKDEETGEISKKKVKLSRPVLRSSIVFNIQDVDGLPEKQRQSPEQLGWKQADLLQEIKELTGIDVKLADKPFYVPTSDEIAMPTAEAYINEKIYAETLIHETIHWTGHSKRLDRLNEHTVFGSKAYAREELVAEIGTLLTAQKAGIEIEHENGESYIQSWWKPLKEELEQNPKLILDIAKDAYTARNYILEGKELDRLQAASVSHHIELTDEERESGRVNFEVPFSEKNAAKALARSLEVDLKWDRKGKVWFAQLNEGQNIGDLAKYRATESAESELETERLNLNIPFTQKDQAQASAKELDLKLQWDKEAKTWFVHIHPGSDIGELAKYAPKEYAKPSAILGQQDHVASSDREKAIALQRLDAADHAKAITEGDLTLSTLLDPVIIEATQTSMNDFIENHKDVSYTEMVELVSDNLTHQDKENFKQALLDAEITRAEELFKPMNAPESEFDEIKFNFEIPYTRKDEAKELAKKFELQLRWSKTEKNWYAFAMEEKGKQFQEELSKILTPSAPKKEPSSDRIALNIPYHIKDEAKQIAKDLGFTPRWNGTQWTAKISEETAKQFKKALVQALDEKDSNVAEPSSEQQKMIEKDDAQKVFLLIPYEEKDLVKKEAKKIKMPLKYDADIRSWYTYKDQLQPSFEKFIPDESDLSSPNNGADDSLFSALNKIGAASAPPELKLDGKFHRIKDVNDKRGETSIAYRGYNNGVPNATIINHKTGERVKWVGKSPELTREEREALTVLNKNREEEFRAKSLKEKEDTAQRVCSELSASPSAETNHAYLVKKGIGPHSFKQDTQGNLIIPLTNTRGEIRNVQRINPDGQKWYAKGGEKQGNFHAITKPNNGTPIIIAEGVATAATLTEVLNLPAVAALDAGNLSAVAKNLHKAYPDSPLILAGDNDHQKPYLDPPKENVGYNKAKAAAKEVGADFLAPSIEDPDNASDSDKRITDFNDLVAERGQDSLKEAFASTLATLEVRRARVASKEEVTPTKGNQAATKSDGR